MAIGDNVGLLFRIKSEYDPKGSSAAKTDIKELEAEAGKASSGGLSSLTESLTGAGTGASSMAGGVALATGAITAIAGAAITAGTVLFNLANSAAEFGSKIFDATEKTGLSAEAISSLKVAADQSGSSLEQITGSISKFSKLIGEAAEGSKTAKASLIQLGLDPKQAINDLDGSLAKVFKTIFDAKNPIIQTKLATEAFGKSGADVIPVIKSFDGDMTGLIAKAKQLGLTLDNEAAKAADDFGDTFDTVKAQVSGAGYTIAREFMPQITTVMKDLSKLLIENKNTFITWGTEIAHVLEKLHGLFDWFSSSDGISTMAYIGQIIKYSTGNYTGIYVPTGAVPNTPKQKSLADTIIDADTNTKPDITLIDKDAEKKREEALKKQLEEIKKYNALEIESYRQGFETNQKNLVDSLEKKNITTAQYNDEALKALSDFQINVANLMQQGFDLDRKGKKGQELDNITLQYQNAQQKFLEEIGRQKETIEKKTTEIEKKESTERIKISEDEAKRKIELQKAQAATETAERERDYKNKILTEDQYQSAIGQIKLASLEFEKKRNEEARNGLDENSEKYIEYTQKIALLDEQLKQQQIESSNAVAEAIEKETSAMERFGNTRERIVNQGASGGGGSAQDGTGGARGQAGGDGGGFIGGILQGLGTSVEDAQKPINILNDLGQMLASTFHQVAQGVGEAVKSFVLFGTAGGSFRKFAAEVIASVAQMAIVQAVFELAQGLAMTALSWFTGNPKYAASAGAHYAAAAAFGIIGGVAALAGRAVAGNAFNQQANSATGAPSGSGSSGGGLQAGAYSGQSDATITQDRNAPSGAYSSNRNRFVVTLQIQSNDSHIVKVVKDGATNPGPLRNAFIEVVNGS